MARMRILSEAYCQLKQDDPETAITLCALRRIVKTGDIPSVPIGRKTLIDYDLLVHYLRSGAMISGAVEPENVGGIRKVSIN